MMNLFALTAGLAATASAFDCHGPYFSFYNRAGNAMSFQRLDPALFPGQQSPHLHSFDGGNGLAADMTFETTQESTCTTARIKTDKSLYWRPTLFWNGNNTGFYKVPDKFLKIYYKFGDPGNEKATVSEFPENFQMIAGDPFKRAEGDNPAGVKWACLGEGYSRIDATGFPKGFDSCKEGLTAELTFPACWNGKDLDPKAPAAHMAWPTANGKGIDACPEGFKVKRFPSIFIEFWYDVSAFDGHYTKDDMPWVLANGDPTGYGFHADFRNGWEKGVLAKATADEGYCNCGCGCGNDQMKECFGAENVNDDNDAEFKSCTAKQAFGEDKTQAIDKLPGCNPLQAGPQRATVVSGPGCTAAAAPASGSTKTAGSSAGGADATPTATGGSGATQTPAQGAPSGGAGADDKPDTKTDDKPAGTTNAQGNAQQTTFPTLNKSVKIKGETHVPSAGNDDGVVAPTQTKGSNGSNGYNTALPSLSIVSSTATPAPTGGKGSGSGSGNDDDETCPAPTTVTITPTVYITAGAAGAADVTSCDAGTVYTTVTNTATVTVQATGYGYMHKRHADIHHKY